MKILLLNDYATPTAGAELVTTSVRDGLRAAGHEVRVLATRAKLIPGPSFADARCFGTTGPLQSLTTVLNPSAARCLRRELERFSPDVVQVHMFEWQLSPSILPLLRDVPCVHYAMTYKAICPTGSKLLPDGSPCGRPAGLACRRARCVSPLGWAPHLARQQRWRAGAGSFDRVVAVSAAVRERLEHAGVAVDAVIAPGVPDRGARPGPAAAPTVAYAGRLSREKGVDVLLRAFRGVLDREPAARLLLAGSGPEEASLRALAGSLGLEPATRWLGQLGGAELHAELGGAWVHAVPSVWDEPFGLTAPEAMMRGTPVVASGVGGLAESVVDGVTGLHVPPGDPAALADALGGLLGDPGRAVRLGAAGRARALAELGIARSAARLGAVHAELVPAAVRA